MSHQQPFVSVVTPFYNTAPFLRQCLDSLLGQSYDNFELVIVDNQSNDGSWEIAQSYETRDSRVRLVRTPSFLPQLENYNFALRQISPHSRYCKMAMADDWLFPRCLQEMVELAEDNPTVGIVTAYELQSKEVLGSGLDPSITLLSGRDACRRYLLEGLCMFGSPNTVMYRADLVRQRTAFFPPWSLHADTEIAFELLREHDLGIVHQVLSYTRIRSDSISGLVSEFNPQALDLLIIAKRYGRYFLDGTEYDATVSRARAWFYGNLVRGMVFGGFSRAGRRDFLEYQVAGLSRIEERVQTRLVAKHLGATVLEELLAPFQLAKKLKSAATSIR